MYKQREELGERYIDMLRALLSADEFLELDGSRRWIPRTEQQVFEFPAEAPTGKDGELSTEIGTNTTGGQGSKGSPSPKKGGAGSTGIGTGSGKDDKGGKGGKND
jgi:hypothetical protein